MNAQPSRQLKTDGFEFPRARMVEKLRDYYKISDERVLDVMNRLPRHVFVPDALKAQAYKDNALPIAGGQTISQPFIVARMSELLTLSRSDKVLEIGGGTGYQTAVLTALARTVFTIERLPHLAKDAYQRLQMLGIRNFSLKCDDGTEGWPDYAPFDKILVAAGSPELPKPLLQQLKVGGRLVIPVGRESKSQTLVRVTRTETGFKSEDFGPCSFVPLIGEFGWNPQS